MRSRIALLGLVAAACLPAAAPAQTTATDKWQSVAKTDNQEAFVNVLSITTVGAHLEAKVKLNFATPQPAAKKGKSYLSARNTYRFDCAQRRIGMKELRAFEAADLQGPVVQKATSSDKNLQWFDAPDSTVFGEILDFVCRPPAG